MLRQLPHQLGAVIPTNYDILPCVLYQPELFCGSLKTSMGVKTKCV